RTPGRTALPAPARRRPARPGPARAPRDRPALAAAGHHRPGRAPAGGPGRGGTPPARPRGPRAAVRGAALRADEPAPAAVDLIPARWHRADSPPRMQGS